MMRDRRRRRRVPELNTTSTADISFMLLTFFLVTTSMDTDRGIASPLPPPQTEQHETESEVERRNVLFVAIDDTDSLTLNGEALPMEQLRARLRELIANPTDNPAMPQRRMTDVPGIGKCHVADAHVILLQTSRVTSYAAYFAAQEAIASAYADLRNALARKKFGQAYAKCSPEQREAIRTCFPQHVSEAPAEEEGGGQ